MFSGLSYELPVNRPVQGWSSTAPGRAPKPPGGAAGIPTLCVETHDPWLAKEVVADRARVELSREGLVLPGEHNVRSRAHRRLFEA